MADHGIKRAATADKKNFLTKNLLFTSITKSPAVSGRILAKMTGMDHLGRGAVLQSGRALPASDDCSRDLIHGAAEMFTGLGLRKALDDPARRVGRCGSMRVEI
jgi:hypothetical protein